GAGGPREVADIPTLRVGEEVGADEIVAVAAIRNLFGHADARTEGVAATAAVAAVPDMMRPPARRTAVMVSGVSGAGQRNKQPQRQDSQYDLTHECTLMKNHGDHIRKPPSGIRKIPA